MLAYIIKVFSVLRISSCILLLVCIFIGLVIFGYVDRFIIYFGVDFLNIVPQIILDILHGPVLYTFVCSVFDFLNIVEPWRRDLSFFLLILLLFLFVLYLFRRSFTKLVVFIAVFLACVFLFIAFIAFINYFYGRLILFDTSYLCILKHNGYYQKYHLFLSMKTIFQVNIAFEDVYPLIKDVEDLDVARDIIKHYFRDNSAVPDLYKRAMRGVWLESDYGISRVYVKDTAGFYRRHHKTLTQWVMSQCSDYFKRLFYRLKIKTSKGRAQGASRK